MPIAGRAQQQGNPPSTTFCSQFISPPHHIVTTTVIRPAPHRHPSSLRSRHVPHRKRSVRRPFGFIKSYSVCKLMPDINAISQPASRLLFLTKNTTNRARRDKRMLALQPPQWQIARVATQPPPIKGSTHDGGAQEEVWGGERWQSSDRQAKEQGRSLGIPTTTPNHHTLHRPDHPPSACS